MKEIRADVGRALNSCVPYRVMIDNGISPRCLLGRQLMAQSNETLNKAMRHIQARRGYVDVFLSSDESAPDVTAELVAEIGRLQGTGG